MTLLNKVQTDVDFCKVFDKVSYCLLLYKWILSFLSGCSQSVIRNGSTLYPVCVTSVPQVTVLGS